MVVSASSKHGEQQPSPSPGRVPSPFCAFHETLPESAPYLGDMGVPGLGDKWPPCENESRDGVPPPVLGGARVARVCPETGGDDGGRGSEGVTPRGDGSATRRSGRGPHRAAMRVLAKTSPTNARTSC